MNVQVVPWYSGKEWSEVKNYIYDENQLNKQKAVEKMEVWKTRRSNLPTAVECTMFLVEVNNRHEMLNNCANEIIAASFTDTDLHLMYCTAIVRFINFALDSRVGERVPFTMYKQALNRNIPEWIVQIRHDVSHGQTLPSLSLLQIATDFALKWLYKNYWSLEDKASNKNERVIPNHLDSTRMLHLWILVNQKLTEGFCYIHEIDEIHQELSNIFPKFKNNRILFTSTLESLLGRLLKKLSRFLKNNDGKSFINYLLSEKSNFLFEDFPITEAKTHTHQNRKCWQPVLQVIATSSSFPYLLEQLIEAQNDPQLTEKNKKIAALWLNKFMEHILNKEQEICNLEMLKSDRSSKMRNTKKIASLIKHENQFVQSKNAVKRSVRSSDLHRILKLALNTPNANTPLFIENLLAVQNPSLSKKIETKILQLTNIYLGNVEKEFSSMEDDIFTVSHLTGGDMMTTVDTEEEIVKSKIEDINMSEDTHSVWKKCSNKNEWRRCPLGTIPLQRKVML